MYHINCALTCVSACSCAHHGFVCVCMCARVHVLVCIPMCHKPTVDVDFAQCQPVRRLSGPIDLYEQESPCSDVITPQSLQDSGEHALVDQADVMC